MALHPALHRSPYAVLEPAHRWFPADEARRASAYEKLLPPLVARIRADVAAWRAGGHADADQCADADVGTDPRIDGVMRPRRRAPDATAASALAGVPPYRFVSIEQEGFDRHRHAASTNC